VLVIRRSNCIIQHLLSSHTVGGRAVRRLREYSLREVSERVISLRESSLNLCTGRTLTEKSIPDAV